MLKWINDNYKKVNDITNIYIKDEKKAQDLFGVILDIIMNQKTNKLDKIPESEKFFMIIRMIRNEAFNKKSKYHKLYTNNDYNYDNYYLNYEQVILDFDHNKEKQLLLIKKTLKNLISKKQITIEDRNCFNFYYLPELSVSIKKMNIKEVNKLRNISYRTLAKKTNWNYQQIRFSVIKVVKLLKVELNINN